VSNLGKILLCLLLALAGCSTAPRQPRSPRAPDWNSPDTVKPSPEAAQPAPPPAPVPVPAPSYTNSYAATWISLARWSRENGCGSLRQISFAPLPTFALTTSNGILILHANSLVAKWDGLELHLGFAPQLIGGQPFVHVLDLEKNIEPLLYDFSLPTKTNRVIVIDPGHGGVNGGTTNVLDNTAEKELTLDWARRLAALLATNGWEVFLTRTNDVDVSLSNRVAFTEEQKADLFISLHFNSAAPNQEQAGLETFCLTPTGMPSTLTRGYDDDVSLAFPNNAFDAENLQYALRLHRALLQMNRMADRGVRRARFLTVLRGQNRPAVLIEGGYLSNPREARRISDPAYRQKLAVAVARALTERSEAGSQKSEAGPPTSSLQPMAPSLSAPTSHGR